MKKNRWIIVCTVYVLVIVLLCMEWPDWSILFIVLGIMGIIGFLRTRKIVRDMDHIDKDV